MRNNIPLRAPHSNRFLQALQGVDQKIRSGLRQVGAHPHVQHYTQSVRQRLRGAGLLTPNVGRTASQHSTVAAPHTPLASPTPPPLADQVGPLPELSIVIVRANGLQDLAQHQADNVMEVAGDHYQGLQGIVRQVADSFRRPMRRATAVMTARSNMLNQQNIYGDPARQAEHDREMEAIRLRFTLGGPDQVFSDLADRPESREVIPANQQDPRRVQILALMELAISTGMTEDNFRLQQRDLYRRLGLADQQSIMTDNLWLIVQALRPDPQFRARLQTLKIVLGEASIGLRTQTKYSLVDRALHRLEGVPVLNMLSPSVVATGVALATAVTISSAKGLLAVGAPVIGSAAVSGLAGYIQTHEATQRDIYNDRRDAAISEAFDATSRERNKLQQAGTRFDMRDAVDMTNSLNVQLPDPATLSHQAHFVHACQAYQDLLQNYAEARARIGLSNRQRIDLIRFSSPTSIEAERLILTVAVASARETLRSYHASLLQAAGGTLVPFGLTNDATDMMNTRVAQVEGDIQRRVIDTVQRTTKSFVRQKSLKHAAIAAGASVAFAGVTYGLSQAVQSILSSPGGLQGPSFSRLLPGSQSEVHLLGGQTLEPNSDGSFSIEQDGKVKVHGVRFTQGGTLTEDTKALLQEKGYFFHDKGLWSENVATEQSVRLSPEQYLKEQSDALVTIDHIEWADNNTPVFDKNELRLDWGGPNNTGITEDGYVFSTQRMTPDGSYHHQETFDATVKDKLYNVFSITQGAETKVFVYPDGAVIPKDSDAGKMLFREVNGKAVFLGNYAHAMYFDTPPVPGQSIPRGVSLATHVGSNTPASIEKIVTSTQQVSHGPSVSIVPPLEASRDGTPFVLPLPLFLRKELERPHRSQSSHPSAPRHRTYYAYGGHRRQRPHTFRMPYVAPRSTSGYPSSRSSISSLGSLHPLDISHAAMAGGTNTGIPFTPLFGSTVSNLATMPLFGGATFSQKAPFNLGVDLDDDEPDDDGPGGAPTTSPSTASTSAITKTPKTYGRPGRTKSVKAKTYSTPKPRLRGKKMQKPQGASPLHTVVESLLESMEHTSPSKAQRAEKYLEYYAYIESVIDRARKSLRKENVSLEELQKLFAHQTIPLASIPEPYRRKVRRSWMQAQFRATPGKVGRREIEALRHKRRIPLTFFLDELEQTGDDLFNLRLDLAEKGDVVWENINMAFNSREKLEQAEKVVILANRAIGDSVLMLPLLVGLNAYYAENRLPKKKVEIFVGPATYEIARAVAHACSHLDVTVQNHPGDLGTSSKGDDFLRSHVGENDFFFAAGFDLKFSKKALPKATVYMNYHTFDDYSVRSYISEFAREKHSLGLPANTLRFLERLTGQKLFSHPKNVKQYIEVHQHPDFDYLHRSQVLRRYEIEKDEEVLLIASGSAVRAKEYPPKQMAKMVELLLKNLQKSRLQGKMQRMPRIVLLPHEKNPDYAKELLALKKKLAKTGNKVLADQISVGAEVEPMKNIMYLIDRAKVMFTPDTGLGHLASLMGTKNVMPTMSDAAFWSGPHTRAVWHEKALDVFKSPEKARLVQKLWNEADADQYSVYDDTLGKRIGAQDFQPDNLATILAYHMRRS